MKEALFKSLSIIQYVNRCSNKKGTLLTVRRVYWLKARQKHKNNKTNTSANTLGVRPRPPPSNPEGLLKLEQEKNIHLHTLHIPSICFFSKGKYLLFSDMDSAFNPPKDWCVVWGTYVTIHYVHKLYATRDCSLLTYTFKKNIFFFFTVWSCCIFKSFDTWRLEMYSIFLMAIQYSLQCSFHGIKCT